MLVSFSCVTEVTRTLLVKYGVSERSAEILAESVLYAGRCGISTHGIRHLPMYINKIKSGHLNPKDEVELVTDNGAVAVLDANRCLGQVAARQAIDLAVEKAKEYGVAAVGIRNSNTFGAAGYYAYLAAQQGMASVIFANSAPAIAPTGGKKTIFGTNPICFGFPGGEESFPIVLDMATTVVARSKVRMAAKNGDKIPTDWAIGPDGQPTDDPNEALKGSLLPIGGYKGYGLSLFIDLFAGLLTGAAFAGGVKPLSDMESDSNCGQLFIVFDTKRFLDQDELDHKSEFFRSAVKACGDEGAVMLPGEPQFKRMAEQKDAVFIADEEALNINRLAEQSGISARLEQIQ